ncbi:D-2-hydroxyacid dehydrogenase [Bdellovibrio bacteriovorus]|uniref:Phosphoglycerate dehydrogenase n=1 Tax=Bdellovibrio bacteriovorus (strain ATCC 15356 / DSM 50701 / NCIMB 9529 / HD100) TaxID=264462 RepID=Q6MN05_BDEBA|nr:D-2-hydroxyacid dehydrogenase [Bdellovibrio bacteriovorus]AHZ84020.1 phosphoglycerate dehydrogenase [Bdellovibrio bacteriovorus]BEV67903.1 Hydroxypyruvate reductase [Bdellovibrio bacteriovorus]CAE79347.1 phosphoglycerate dehydrogenase [Bdellovibrio bacteriovorus HD100]
MKKKILITDRFAQDSFLYLQQHSQFEVVRSDNPQHLPLEHLVSAHALIIRSRTKIDEELLKKARQLQLIVTCTSGFDHIDLEATQKWGVTVMHTPTANIESAAQLTWGLVLSCVNNIQAAHKMVKAGEWNRDQITGIELAGRNYGIVGLGRIGSRVAELAQAFGMNVVAYDPYQEDEVFERLHIPRLSYEEVLKTADVISFHVPKTLETEHMLNRSQFEYIHRGIVLINTSRGSVINENDLCEALEKGWLRSVGLDVYEKEPLNRNSNLLKYPNLVLTPHIGANTEDAFFKASQIAANKLMAFFVDGSTSDTLPPRAPWYGAAPFKGE